MGGKALIYLLIGMIGLAGLVFQRINSSNLEQELSASALYLRETAANTALSGVKLGLRQLSENKYWRTGYTNLPAGNGRVTVTLVDSLFDGDSVVIVRATGIAGIGTSEEMRKTREALVRFAGLPHALKAAITVRNPIKVNGLFQVDGRNHTPTGVPIANSGVLGIYSTNTVAQQGGATIGGTVGGVDYVPAAPASPGIVLDSQIYPGGYPGTPDSVMGGAKAGFTEGTLKSIAQSGTGGSQYTTNPATLSWPIAGVTYVELPPGGSWVNPDLNGSGILIVHNNSCNALLKNVNSGTFSGLIIADDIDGLKINMIGAMFCLSPTPIAGQVIGNAQGSLRFSSEAVKMTIDDTKKRSPKKQSASSTGGSLLDIVAWRE